MILIALFFLLAILGIFAPVRDEAPRRKAPLVEKGAPVAKQVRAPQKSQDRQVTMDGYDADTGVTVDPINLWRDYRDRMGRGTSGQARHGEKVTLIRREGNGVLVETDEGTHGWATYYFIRELK